MWPGAGGGEGDEGGEGGEGGGAGQVRLRVEEREFLASREELCRSSEYFRAMFSGRYRERALRPVRLEIVDAKSMEEILKYIKTDEIELDLRSIREVAMTARFLQIDKLIQLIETFLIVELRIFANWLEILEIAEVASLDHIVQPAAALGIYSFELMANHETLLKTPSRLHWYLSHTHLSAESELDVFDFGVQWIDQNERLAESNPDLILLVIGCLDIAALKERDLKDMGNSDLLLGNKKANDIVNCLIYLRSKSEICEAMVLEDAQNILKMYSDEIYDEVLMLVTESVRRVEIKQPCVLLRTTGDSLRSGSRGSGGQHMLYKWCGEERKFEAFLEIAASSVWGYSLAVWGTHKLVVTGGETRPGGGLFEQSVKVWDSLLGHWSLHKQALSKIRHATTVVHGNTLYIVGGVGAFRIILNTVYAYDLVKQIVHELPRLPFVIQNPATAIHKGQLYVAGADHTLYTLRHTNWVTVVKLDMRPAFLVSIGDNILMTEGSRRECTIFDAKSNAVRKLFDFDNYVVGVCDTGRQVFAFTELSCSKSKNVEIVDTRGPEPVLKHVVSMPQDDEFTYSAVAGCPALALTLPPVTPPRTSQFAIKYLKNITYVD